MALLKNRKGEEGCKDNEVQWLLLLKNITPPKKYSLPKGCSDKVYVFSFNAHIAYETLELRVYAHIYAQPSASLAETCFCSQFYSGLS